MKVRKENTNYDTRKIATQKLSRDHGRIKVAFVRNYTWLQ